MTLPLLLTTHRAAQAIAILLVLASPVASLRAQPAPASNESAPVALPALRVTADLWESPLDRIPASVTVFDEAALRSRGTRHFGDLADQIPNLTWSGGTSRPRYFQIRGIGENSQFEGETPDSTVRFLVDDLDFTGLGSVAGTFDVSQVEVLRGPQAGAFGANAAGGLVRLVSNAPTPFWTGNLESTIGGDGLREFGVAAGGPLLAGDPDKLMARVAIHHHASDGFRHNATLNADTNSRDELNARLRVTFNPSAAWKWDAAVVLSELDNGYDEFALDNNGELTFSDQPGRDTQESIGASLRGTFTGTAVRFTSVSAAARVDSVYSYDDDWTDASYEGFSDLRRERSVFSQELRLDSLLTRDALGWIDRWTIGAYFSGTDEASRYTNEDPGNVRGLQTQYDASHQAVFGQIGHDVSDRSRLTFGIRAERLDLDGGGVKTRFRKGPGTFDPVVRFAPRFDDVMLGGKIALEYDVADNAVAFASITRGYKGGGINVDARIDPTADPLTYATEYLWNLEAGIRGHWLERRLHGEFTLFRTTRHDTQVRDSAGFAGSYRFFTDNAGFARIDGLEATLTYQFADAWSLRAGLAHMESSIDTFTLANGTVVTERRLANTPRFGYSLGLGYGNEHGWFGSAELIGRSQQFDSNNHAEARRPFDVLNATIGYSWNCWTISVWVRNLLDEEYDKRVFFFGNEDPDYLPARYATRADPRQVGVTVRYRW